MLCTFLFIILFQFKKVTPFVLCWQPSIHIENSNHVRMTFTFPYIFHLLNTFLNGEINVGALVILDIYHPNQVDLCSLTQVFNTRLCTIAQVKLVSRFIVQFHKIFNCLLLLSVNGSESKSSLEWPVGKVKCIGLSFPVWSSIFEM